MTRQQLIQAIKTKRSFLCVGLDTDLLKIPSHLKDSSDPVFEFNKAIIDTTHSYCVAYKPNIAFYESQGPAGWESLRKTLEYIPRGILTIADAKRGDIGNTSAMYAKTFFNRYDFDAVTVAPYMGADSVKPFLDFPGKWTVLLALTSNDGAADFQVRNMDNGKRLFEQVLDVTSGWGTPDNMMYVVGATRGDLFTDVRRLIPDHFILVPGVGAQGGSLKEVCRFGINDDCGLLVNSSRNIIYAASGPDFAEAAGKAAHEMQQEMDTILASQGIF